MDKHHQIRVYLAGLKGGKRETLKIKLLLMTKDELHQWRRKDFLRKTKRKPVRVKPLPPFQHHLDAFSQPPK